MSSDPPTPKPKRQKYEEKIAELEKQLAEERTLAETYLTQLRYTKADLDNIQKQSQKRIEDAIDRSNARILSQLITLADELDMVAADSKNEGVAMIHCKLLKLLEAEDVRPMEVSGKHFDPYKHEAVVEVEACGCPPGTVVEEIRRGYTYKDKVLRAAMVKVARAPSKQEDGNDV